MQLRELKDREGIQEDTNISVAHSLKQYFATDTGYS